MVEGTQEEKAASKNSFEILAVDKKLVYINSITVNPVLPKLTEFVQPAVFDFVVYNKFIYALDMNCRFINIYDEGLEVNSELQPIPIPESLNTSMKNIHLAISYSYIFISAENTIYFTKKNKKPANYKKLEFEEQVIGITCYGEEYILLKFIEKCSLFKIEDILSFLESNPATKVNHTFSNIIHFIPNFPDELKGLKFTTFMIQDDFLYSLCTGPKIAFKLNLGFNLPPQNESSTTK